VLRREAAALKTVGRRLLMCAILVLLFASPLLAAAPRPNIVFILADDVGCEPLGCYGGTSYATPNIDRLAESGMKFNHAYSMPVCHPTRTTFLLGQYPMHSHATRWGSFPKDRESDTLGWAMQQAGYKTAVAGKWQLALLGKDLDHPYRMGFDQYSLFGWHEGPRFHNPLIYQNGKQRADTAGKYGPDLYVEFLVDFMTRNQDSPFFAFYSMALCHAVTNDLDAPVPYAPGKNRYLNYAEMIASMDRCVGRLVDALDQFQLRDRTLIVFTGDNGTARSSIIRAERAENGGRKGYHYIQKPVFSVQHGRKIRGGKGSLTDAGTNVPLICSWPGTIAAGQTTDDLVDFSDFFPTFAELAGQTPGDFREIDGRSFAGRLTGHEAGPRAWAFAEHQGKYWVRTRRWKLYNDRRFYDVRSDPQEKRDLADAIPAGSDYELLRDAMGSL
jgi:arylsulfatase A